MDQESTNNDDLASQLATNEIPDTVEPHSEPINSIAEELGTNTNTTTTATSSPVIPTPDIPEMNSEGNTTVQESEELENVDPVHEEPIETEDQKLAEPELGPTENDSTELDNDEPAHDTVESNEEPEEISQTETDHSFTESNEEPKELSQPEADHSFIESNEIAEDDFDDFNNTIKDESVQDQENENVNESVNENENENENKNENENENKNELSDFDDDDFEPQEPNQDDKLDQGDEEDDDFGDFDDFGEFEEDQSFDQQAPVQQPESDSQPQLPTSFVPTFACLNESDFANSAHLQASIEHILTEFDQSTGSSVFTYTLASANNTQIAVYDSNQKKSPNPTLSRASSLKKPRPMSGDISEEPVLSDVDDDEEIDSSHIMNTDNTEYTQTFKPSTANSSANGNPSGSVPDPGAADFEYHSSLSYFTVRSKSLWDQLAQAPSGNLQSAATATDWKRSAIRRGFLVSLGVPVDLDEVMPQKEKQKRLILPTSLNSTGSNSNRNSDDARRHTSHGHKASVQVESQGEGAHDHRRVQSSSGRMGADVASGVASTSSKSGSSGGALQGATEQEEKKVEAAISEWTRLSSVSELAIKNMTADEIRDYIKSVAVALDSVKTVHGQWIAKRDDALKDKAAFEGVIESLVDYAQRVGKSGGKKTGSSGSGNNSPSLSGQGSAPGSGGGHKKQGSTLGRANSFLRRRRTDQ